MIPLSRKNLLLRSFIYLICDSSFWVLVLYIKKEEKDEYIILEYIMNYSLNNATDVLILVNESVSF